MVSTGEIDQVIFRYFAIRPYSLEEVLNEIKYLAKLTINVRVYVLQMVFITD